MNSSKIRNKKTIMSFAGLQILFFHLWINVFPGNEVESFLRTTSYIGVDIFFFLSAYSIGGREMKSYGSFIAGRFRSVYLKFILFAIAACAFGSLKLSRLPSVIFAVDFFRKGGTSFLGFLPSIMIFYIFAPFIKKAFDSRKVMTVSAVLIIWAAVGLAVSGFTDHKALFAFWNRIPVIMLGFIMSGSDAGRKITGDVKKSVAAGIPLLAFGILLLYEFGYKTKLQEPFTDFFYVAAIPAALGIILLVSNMPDTEFTKKLGSSTLEMYGIQMIFGYKAANRFFSYTESALTADMMTVFFVCGSAIVLSELYRRAKGAVMRRIDRCYNKTV